MQALFPTAAFAGALAATYWSLGWGFVATFVVGYFSAVIRANYLSVYTTFMFDAAVLGLYLGFILTGSRRGRGVHLEGVPFVVFLIAWPVFVAIVPVNHYLVQLAALRAAVWFLPVLLIAARLTTADLALVTRGLALLNLVALAVGIYLYKNGVEALYPNNAVTTIIYLSNDVAGNRYHRIPATFLSAHAYGGTMLTSLPFLLDRLAGRGVGVTDRWLALAGLIAAAGGLLMCGARSPLVLLALMLLIAWPLSRFSLKLLAILAVFVGGGLLVASGNERFQRANTLGDTEYVSKRIHGSANEVFFQLLLEYPAGAGMGSAVGTSIPYFLAHVAPEPIGLENEYCRILIDQGWVGLGGWLAFLTWLLIRPPLARMVCWRAGIIFMYALCLGSWLTAFLGTGMLASIPGSVLLLTQMGVLLAVRTRGAVSGAIRPRPVPVKARGTRDAPPGMVRGPGGCSLPQPRLG
jgi:hypothetical protein